MPIEPFITCGFVLFFINTMFLTLMFIEFVDEE